MKIDRTMEKQFPNLSDWIRVEIPKCRFNKKIFNAFVKYSQLSEDDAAKALAFNGAAPTLDVAVTRDYGFYSPFRHPDKVFLQRKLCRNFEKLGGDLGFNSNYDMILKATILHEMIHWADHITDGKKQPNGDVYDGVRNKWLYGVDVGFQFESEAFYGIYTKEYVIR